MRDEPRRREGVWERGLQELEERRDCGVEGLQAGSSESVIRRGDREGRKEEEAHRETDGSNAPQSECVGESALCAYIERYEPDGAHLGPLRPARAFLDLHLFLASLLCVCAAENRVERGLHPVCGGDHGGEVRDERGRVDVWLADEDEVDERDCRRRSGR